MKVSVSIQELRQLQPDDTKVLDLLEQKKGGFLNNARESLATGMEATASAVKPK